MEQIYLCDNEKVKQNEGQIPDKSDLRSTDPFYSESNIRYLERKKREIDGGKAHFAEHELIEVD